MKKKIKKEEKKNKMLANQVRMDLNEIRR